MKCLFCPTVDIVLPSMLGLRWECKECQTTFYDEDGVLAAWQFCTKEYKGNNFWVTWLRKRNCIEIRKQKGGLIITLPGEANITPHNFLQKISLILTFQ